MCYDRHPYQLRISNYELRMGAGSSLTASGDSFRYERVLREKNLLEQMAKTAWKRRVIGNSQERKTAPISWGKEFYLILVIPGTEICRGRNCNALLLAMPLCRLICQTTAYSAILFGVRILMRSCMRTRNISVSSTGILESGPYAGHSETS